MNNHEDDLNDIGYKHDNNTLSGRIERYSREHGADMQVIIWMLNLEYSEFMSKMRIYVASQNDNDKLTKEDAEMLSTMFSEPNFKEYKKSTEQILEGYEEEESQVDDDYVIPYREIFNGNFPKLKKDLLTEEEKIALNVANLVDEEYDVFVDNENDVQIPVYYNIGTKNEKWFQFCVYLEKLYAHMKIEANHWLPLITFDRDLLGHDMLSTNNTNEFNGRVAHECENNIIFAIRECARFEDGQGRKQRTELSLGDWTWLWLYAQCFNTYREAPRQTGKTFLVTMVFGVEFAISYERLLAIIIHFKSSEAMKNRNKMLSFANLLPDYLKTHNIKTKTTRGVESMYVASDMVGGKAQESDNIFKRNKLKTVAVGKQEETAEKVARGDTTQLISGDEINFITKIKIVLTAITFAHSTAKEMARKAGKRYGMHFTSTAGKLHTTHGRQMFDLIYNKMCMFMLDLFAYNFKDLETFLRKESEINFFVIKYDYDELGYTEEWLDSRIEQSASTEDIIIEIFQRWMSVDKNILFKLDLVRRLERMVKHQITTNFIYKKNTVVQYLNYGTGESFENVIRSKNAMIWGIDPSSGGGDYSVIYAYDMQTLKPVFIYRTNSLVVTDFAKVVISLARFVKELNPNMTFVINPEQNGPGLALIPMLMEQEDIEPHIYRTIEKYDKRAGTKVTKGWHRQYSDEYFLNYGSNMNKKISDGRNLRYYMFETLLFEIMDKYPYALSIPDMFSEVMTLVRKGGKVDGKIEARSGFHDDVVCAGLHGITPVLHEYGREMLYKFFNYTVDISLIENMAVSSPYAFGGADQAEVVDLESKVDYEVMEVGTETGATYETMTLYTYVSGVRTQVTDEDKIAELITNSELLTNVRKSLKQLTYAEVTELAKAQLVSSRLQDVNTREEARATYHSSVQHTNKGIVSASRDRTSHMNDRSQGFMKKNKLNNKIKMF